MPIDTETLAKKILETGFLEGKTYNWKELFDIEFHVDELLGYFPEDKNLQDMKAEVRRYIIEKGQASL